MARRQLGTAPSNAADTATKGYVDTATTNMVTTTGTQSLSNKTISGANNTITNLPASATPDAARLVCTTATGDAAASNGANTWAKIATLLPGSNTASASLVLSVTTAVSYAMDAAVISVHVFQGGTQAANTPPSINVKMLSEGGDGTFLSADSFKIIAGGYGTAAELWIKKPLDYGKYSFYELARLSAGTTITYHDGAPWQSATPSGTTNVSTNGVTAFGVPVVTTTGTQTLENKRLASASVPSTATSTGTTGQIAYDSSHLYICTATNTWRRAALSTW